MLIRELDREDLKMQRQQESNLGKWVNFDNTTPDNFWDDTLIGKVLQVGCDFAGDMFYAIYDSGKRIVTNFCYTLGRSIQ